MTASLPEFVDVEAAMRKLGLGTDASELHGGLCGWLAGGGEVGPGWLAKVLADSALPPTEGVLAQLGEASAAQFEDRDFGFELLLPAGDAALAERSGALFEWCRGFLGGFGLAAGKEPPLSEEGSEALADLAGLAAATPQEEGDQEDEDALAEIEEFVRVAALLLHGDCVLAPRHRQQFH
ncbi:MAG: UPF0149 family protein [Pseudomonadota bacterium]|nr:UPF0149 family protein [Pseudomonadota bacterium]